MQVPRSVQRYVHVTNTLNSVVIYLSECSTCRYVRLNTLNKMHIHGPCFNAPILNPRQSSFNLKFCQRWDGERGRGRGRERESNVSFGQPCSSPWHIILVNPLTNIQLFFLKYRGWHHCLNVSTSKIKSAFQKSIFINIYTRYPYTLIHLHWIDMNTTHDSQVMDWCEPIWLQYMTP